jgi:hypothetical protein
VEGVDGAASECPVTTGHIGIVVEPTEENSEGAPTLLYLVGTFRPCLLEKGVTDGLPLDRMFVQATQAGALSKLPENCQRDGIYAIHMEPRIRRILDRFTEFSRKRPGVHRASEDIDSGSRLTEGCASWNYDIEVYKR